MSRLAIGWVLAMVACSGGEAECGPAECADVCAREAAKPAPAPAVAPPEKPADDGMGDLSDFERDLLKDYIRDVQKGVRPFDAEGFGVCKGKSRDCGGFLGADAGELPPGEYMIQARLAVPKLGGEGTWKVNFATACETIRVGSDGSETRTKNDRDKEYEVKHAGPDRPYRLAPLHVIRSPAKGGRQECSYSLTTLRPDGEKVYEGSYTVPGPS